MRRARTLALLSWLALAAGCSFLFPFAAPPADDDPFPDACGEDCGAGNLCCDEPSAGAYCEGLDENHYGCACVIGGDLCRGPSPACCREDEDQPTCHTDWHDCSCDPVTGEPCQGDAPHCCETEEGAVCTTADDCG